MKYHTMQDALDELEGYISDSQEKKPDPLFQLKRTKYLMNILGNPQEQLKVLHIAGTSGKGSTAHYCANLLRLHGKKIGLTISPHLIDIRERALVDGQLLSEQIYLTYLSQIMPAVREMSGTEWGKPTFFEITMALAFYIFAHEQVEYAVIETGLGGRYDASNVVSRTDKLCVITPIGYDHTEFLGNTLVKIATEKAGIIGSHQVVISAEQEKEVKKIIVDTVQTQGTRFEKKHIVEQSRWMDDHWSFDLTDPTNDYKIRNLILGSPAQYQIENATLAISAVSYVAKRDGWMIDYEKVREALLHTQIAGRFDVRQLGEKTVIFDGAHNPQKMAAFLSSLKKRYPDRTFDFLLAFSRSKDHQAIMEQLAPLVNSVIFTEFGEGNQGMRLRCADAQSLRQLALKMGLPHVAVVLPASKALNQLLNAESSPLVVTGSLYLLSELYCQDSVNML